MLRVLHMQHLVHVRAAVLDKMFPRCITLNPHVHLPSAGVRIHGAAVLGILRARHLLLHARGALRSQTPFALE